MRAREGPTLQALMEVENELMELCQVSPHPTLNELVPMESDNIFDYNNEPGLSMTDFEFEADERMAELANEQQDLNEGLHHHQYDGDQLMSQYEHSTIDLTGENKTNEQNMARVSTDQRYLRCKFKYFHNPTKSNNQCDYCRYIPYVSSPLTNELYRRYVPSNTTRFSNNDGSCSNNNNNDSNSCQFSNWKRTSFKNNESRDFFDDEEYCPCPTAFTDEKCSGLSSYFQKLTTIGGKRILKDKKEYSELGPKIRKVKGREHLNKNA